MIFGNLINLGVKTEMEFYQKREARIVNLVALITLFGLLIGVSTVFFISGDYATASVVFTAISSLLSLYFNYKGLNNTATYVFVITINLTVFILCQQYVPSVGNYLYYFPLIFCVALIHNPTVSNKRTVIFFIITLVSFLCSWILDIPLLKNQTITPEDNATLLVYNSILAFIITIILVFLVVKLINRQNNEAIALLHKEQKAQVVVSQSLKEKDVLLAEIQHRVKNNLAIITGLLNLQTEKAPCEESRQLMVESRNRVMSIAMVHDRLYKKDNLSKINLQLYLSELVKELIKSFPINEKEIEIQEDLDRVEIEITKAVPVGLIINEALTNSLKHAFNTQNGKPLIKITMQLIYDRINISLCDNGIGFSDTTTRKDTALGLSLIESLADQIDAKVVFKNDPGACVIIVFPV
ncbi:MAG: domain S-box [Bacteroidetes bacterium]|jgi:two-component sensor histidine kinase|nr:domain S-box [Bacteroidota bacterium]MDF2450906.1 domain S-box [Bacteroidota bacterium]